MQLSPVAFFFAGPKQPGLKPAAGYGPLNPRRPGWEPRVAYSHSIESDGPYRSRSEQNSRPIQNPSSVPPTPPHLKLAKRAAATFNGGSRRAGHGGAAAALAGGACSGVNPARSPVERCPGVRADGTSRREEGRRPPRHEEQRRLARRRPRQGRVH